MASETYKKLLADVQDPDKGNQLITLNQLWKYLSTIDENISNVKTIQLSLSYLLSNPPVFGVLNDPTNSVISFYQAGPGEFDLTFSADFSAYSFVSPIMKNAFFTLPALFAEITYLGAGAFKIYTFDYGGTLLDQYFADTYVQISLA